MISPWSKKAPSITLKIFLCFGSHQFLVPNSSKDSTSSIMIQCSTKWSSDISYIFIRKVQFSRICTSIHFGSFEYSTNLSKCGSIQTALTGCQHNLKLWRMYRWLKIWTSVHTMLKSSGKCWKFDGTKVVPRLWCHIYLPTSLRIDQFRSKSVESRSVFIIFRRSLDAVSKVCRSKFSFQNLPFSKYTY